MTSIDHKSYRHKLLTEESQVIKLSHIDNTVINNSSGGSRKPNVFVLFFVLIGTAL